MQSSCTSLPTGCAAMALLFILRIVVEIVVENLPCGRARDSGWPVQDVVYSFPVECKNGKWTIVQGLPIDDFAAAKLKATGDELVEEKSLALECLAES